MSTWIERSNGVIYVNSKSGNVPKGNLGGAGVHIPCETEEQAKLLKDHFEKVEREENSLPGLTKKQNEALTSGNQLKDLSDKISEFYRQNPILYLLNPPAAIIEGCKSTSKNGSDNNKQNLSDKITDYYKQNPLLYLLNPVEAVIDTCKTR